MAVVVVSMLLGGCDDGDSRTTARVDRFDDEGRVCLVPEDRSQVDLLACYHYSPSDEDVLKVGACIGVVIPNLVDLDEGAPLRSVKALDRPCRR
ncbi:MAG: hypothetical protein AB7L84_03920 [Acidimicrobiia bacterium]